MQEMRFLLRKQSGVWVALAVDPVAGYMPLLFSMDWKECADLLATVVVNYTIKRMERRYSS